MVPRSRAAVAAGAIVTALALLAGTSIAADERAYELVSPPEKEGNPIDIRGTAMAHVTGDKIVFTSTGAFAGAGTSVLNTTYLAMRTDDGWSVRPLDVNHQNYSSQLGTPTRWIAPGLDRSIQASSSVLAPGALVGGSNIYRVELGASTPDLIAAAAGPNLLSTFTRFGVRPPAAATDDLSHFVFESPTQLLPVAPSNRTNVYAFTDGQLRLVNYLPSGNVAAGGLLSESSTSGALSYRAISNDGRRIFFNAPQANGGLYMRLDGETTVPISVSTRPGDPPTPAQALFALASDDGSVVYFTSNDPLTPDATAGVKNLYRYDVRAAVLRTLTVRTDPADAIPQAPRIYETSADGDAIYFVSKNKLEPDARVDTAQVYRHSETDGTTRVAETVAESAGPSSYGVSPDLRYLAFQTYSAPTGEDNSDPSCVDRVDITTAAGRCVDIYVYDAVREALTCATCSPVDGKRGHSIIGPQFRLHSEYTPRTVLDDGSVFFTTEQALVSGDTNGRRDVYRWKDGANSLISTGKSERDSSFGEASEDGGSVFFYTYEQLVPIDTDNLVDMYAARIGGGIPAQHVRPSARGCSDDSCQGDVATAPVLADIGTSVLDGKGNAADDDEGAAPPRRAAVRMVGTSVRRGRIALRVRVSSGGRVTVTGRAVERVRKGVPRAGTYTVTARLTRSARRQLSRRGRVKARAAVSFAASDGRSAKTVAVITVRG